MPSSNQPLVSSPINITWTDLDKGYSDIPPVVTDFLRVHGIHDFEQHEPGTKIDKKATVGETGSTMEICFLRPKAKNGQWKRLSLRVDLQKELDLGPDSQIQFVLDGGQLMLRKFPKQQDMNENPTISALNGYGFGGLSAAVVPGEVTEAEQQLPSGETPPGVDVGRDFLEEALRNPAGNPRWLFLIGGPGNGKSWISRDIEQKHGLLKDRAEQDMLASREYRHQIDGAELVILNDATITIEEGREKSLQDDLRRYAEDGSHLVASLNRGAIIEDLHKSGAGQKDWTRDILHLLLEDGREPEVLAEKLQPIELVGLRFADSCVAYSMVVGGKTIEFAVSFLDKHSLFEGGGSKLQVGKAGELGRLETPAGKLASNLIGEKYFEEAGCNGCLAEAICPFLANARSLRASEGRMTSGMADIFRASEIASGSPYTYREVWNLLSQAILGRWRPEWQDVHPCHWVQGKNSMPAEDSVPELHRQRFHRSLFPRWEEWCKSRTDDIPVQPFLDAVDPGLDSSGRWASLASDAVQGIRFGTRPYQYVVDYSGKRFPDPEAGLQECITELDLQMDRLRFDDSLDCEEDDGKVGDAITASDLRQPGLELVRLLGFWHGRPAASEVFNQWIFAHSLPAGITLKEARTISKFPLAKGLLRLILPPTEIPDSGDVGEGNTGNACLLPLFEPRTEPLVYPPGEPVICLNADPSDIKVQLKSDGDRLRLLLQQAGDPEGGKPAELDLDFWTCREALVLADHPGGFTEKGFSSAPRLERFRAAICAGLESSLTTITIAGNRTHGAYISPTSNR